MGVIVTNLLSKLSEHSSAFTDYKKKKPYHNPQTILARQVTFLLTSRCNNFIVKKNILKK